MKPIKIVAHAQYDFNDLRSEHVGPEVLQRLSRFGISLEVMPNEKGIERVMATDPFDILIVDKHSWKSSQDIESLCRNRHPEAKIVMFQCSAYATDEEKKKYDAWKEMDPMGRASPGEVIIAILWLLGILREQEAHSWYGFRNNP